MKHIIGITLVIIVAAAAVMGATRFLQPAAGGGFDQLEAWTAAIDNDAPYNHMFEYSAPRSGFRVNGAPVGDINVPYTVRETLLVPGREAAVEQLTGVDLANRATATMVFDNWPKSLVLFAIDAEPGAPEAFAHAYDARDFGTETIAGVPIRHLGEDGAVDPARSSGRADPFDGSLGQSQRVAYFEGTLAGAGNWEGIGQAVTALSSDAECTACLPWREVLAALKADSGAGAHLAMVDGWRAEGFRVETPLAEAGLPVAITPLPVFDTALFAATETGGRYTPYLAVRFPDAADAEAGLAEITSRLNAGVTLDGRAENRIAVENSTIHRIGETGAAVGVVTIKTDDGTPATASTILTTMSHLALRRDFLALAWN